MTTCEFLSREELLELAPLEALGLLDSVEEHQFDKGFQAAAPSVQDEVRDLQAAVAAEFGSVSADQPDRALRFRVLAALSAAVESDDAAVAPIAAIGNPASFQRRLDEAATRSLQSDHHVADAVRRDRAARSSMLWRAAALALGSGLLVTLFFANRLSDTARDLAHLALSNQNRIALQDDLRDQVGPTYASYLDSTSAVVHSMVGTPGLGAGVFFVEPLNQTGLFIAFDVPEDRGPFTLVAIDEATNTRVALATITSNQQLAAVEVDLAGYTGNRFELVDASGVTVLSTTA